MIRDNLDLRSLFRINLISKALKEEDRGLIMQVLDLRNLP